jgi:hypothetical protein
MILISFALALIAIVFGAQLLAQSHKDNLGALYKYLAWFIMIVGFLVLLCDGARGLLRMCHRGEERMMRREMMMDGGGMMGGGPTWMMHHRKGNMNCCNNNCCDGMMNCGGNNGCPDGMMNCPDGGKGGMRAGCPMMGKMKPKSSDSLTTKADK